MECSKYIPGNVVCTDVDIKANNISSVMTEKCTVLDLYLHLHREINIYYRFIERHTGTK